MILAGRLNRCKDESLECKKVIKILRGGGNKLIANDNRQGLCVASHLENYGVSL